MRVRRYTYSCSTCRGPSEVGRGKGRCRGNVSFVLTGVEMEFTAKVYLIPRGRQLSDQVLSRAGSLSWRFQRSETEASLTGDIRQIKEIGISENAFHTGSGEASFAIAHWEISRNGVSLLSKPSKLLQMWESCVVPLRFRSTIFSFTQRSFKSISDGIQDKILLAIRGRNIYEKDKSMFVRSFSESSAS